MPGNLRARAGDGRSRLWACCSRRQRSSWRCSRLRPGVPAGSRPAASGVAASSAAPSAGGQASGGGIGAPRSLPPGLEDRGWITETATQRWLAGSLSGRVLLLPRDEIAFAATSSQVASAQYATNGTSTTLRIRDLADGRLRVSVDRSGAVTSGAFGKGVLYVSGDPAVVGQSDGGVQAVALADGSVTDVIAPGPAPADAAGPVSRFQLRLDPTGRRSPDPVADFQNLIELGGDQQDRLATCRLPGGGFAARTGRS